MNIFQLLGKFINKILKSLNIHTTAAGTNTVKESSDKGSLQ